MGLWTELRLATRLLARQRGFAGAAILTLALGISANYTAFTLLNGLMFRDMPFEDPDRVVDVGKVSYLDLGDWRVMTRTFAGLAAVDTRTMNVSEQGASAERYEGAYISANAFALLGRRPIVGRDFREDDDRPDASPVVLLGYHVWQTRYEGNPAVVGRTIRVNGVPSTVIGVMPERFAFPQVSKLWQPLALAPEALRTNRDAAELEGFGRLRADVTPAQATADLAGVIARLARESGREQPEALARLVPFRAGINADTPASTAMFLMMGAVTFVLLIACANVANLMLVQSAARSRDVSLRLSLGASRWRVIRQLLAESVMLAVAGGGIGLALAAVSIRLASQQMLQTGDAPYWLDFSMDGRAFAFFATTCLGTALVTSLAPAWLTSRLNLAGVLNDGGRGAAGSPSRRRWTGAFVVAQLALTLVLLSGAGTMIRSLLAQVSADAGVDISRLVTLRLDLPAATYSTPDQRQAFYRDLEERLPSGAELRVTIANQVPLGGSGDRQLVTDGRPDVPPGERPEVEQMIVGSRYFDTLGAGLIRGRGFHPGERERVAIVNERVAARHFPGQDPLGRRLRLLSSRGPQTGPDAEWLTIVGVAPDLRQNSIEGGAFEPIVYTPYGVYPLEGAFVLVRSALDTGSMASLLKDRIGTIDPDVPLYNIRTVEEQLARERWGQGFASSMFTAFAGIALILASVGLYAITAYAAAQRTREIGVRVALGAEAGHVWWLVTRRAAQQLGLGLLIGGSGGLAVARALPSELAGVNGGDPMTLAAVAALLVAVGLAAAFVPARRAMRLDPVAALRAE